MKAGRPLSLAAMTAFVLAFVGGSVAAHDPLSPSGGGPGEKAVIVDVGPAPEHALGVSNWGGAVEATDMAGLAQAVRERLGGADDKRPWVRGHVCATYDAVLKVMGRLSDAGMPRVSVFIDREIWKRAFQDPVVPTDFFRECDGVFRGAGERNRQRSFSR